MKHRSASASSCSTRCLTSATTSGSNRCSPERLDNPDPLTYIVTLRRGVKFHDLHEMTAKDVVFTFGQMLDPSFVSPFKGAYRSLESVRPLDDYHVVFTLKEPFTAFRTSSQGRWRLFPLDPASTSASIRSAPGRISSFATPSMISSCSRRSLTTSTARRRTPASSFACYRTTRCAASSSARGSIDLVINDLPPDIVHQFEGKGFAVAQVAGARLLVPRHQHARPGPGGQARAPRDRLRDRSPRDR